MKTTLISTLALSVLGLSSQLAMASDGTVTVNGAVNGNTCIINGGSASFAVTLPSVSTNELASAGQTAGRTPFNIKLTSCPWAFGNIHTFFEAGPTTDATTGRLILAGGGASNVQIGLQNADKTDIKAGFADALQNSKSAQLTGYIEPVPGEGVNRYVGEVTLRYFAQYYATGVATAGVANSSVMYTIAYD